MALGRRDRGERRYQSRSVKTCAKTDVAKIILCFDGTGNKFSGDCALQGANFLD